MIQTNDRDGRVTRLCVESRVKAILRCEESEKGDERKRELLFRFEGFIQALNLTGDMTEETFAKAEEWHNEQMFPLMRV